MSCFHTGCFKLFLVSHHLLQLLSPAGTCNAQCLLAPGSCLPLVAVPVPSSPGVLACPHPSKCQIFALASVPSLKLDDIERTAQQQRVSQAWSCCVKAGCNHCPCIHVLEQKTAAIGSRCYTHTRTKCILYIVYFQGFRQNLPLNVDMWEYV